MYGWQMTGWNGDGLKRIFIVTITKSIIRCGRDEHSHHSRHLRGCANHRWLPKIQSQCFYYWRKLSRRSVSWNKWLDLLSNSLYFTSSASRPKLLWFSHTENGKAERMALLSDGLFQLSINLPIISLINQFVYERRKMPDIISHKPEWCFQLACFIQPWSKRKIETKIFKFILK